MKNFYKLKIVVSLIFVLSILGLFNQVYASTLLDSDTNFDSHTVNGGAGWYIGQTFSPSRSATLSEADFYLSKLFGSEIGTIYAQLYNITGTYGSSSYPTGTELATSSPFDMSTLTTSFTWAKLYFPSGQNYNLIAGNKYAILLYIASSTLGSIMVGNDTTRTQSGGGNYFESTGGSYTATTTKNMLFQVFGTTTSSSVIGSGSGQKMFMSSTF